MRCFPLLPAAALASALIVGCGESPRVTDPTDSPGPSLGAQRFISIQAVEMGGDPSNPLALMVGYDAGTTAEDVCADAGAGNLGLNLLGQVVLTPQGGFFIRTSGRDVNLVVLEFGEGPVTGFCDLVGAPVVGTGTGKATYEVLGPGAALAAHITVQGIVDLVSGGQARVLGTARVTVLPNGTLLFDEERVTLTPL